MEFLDYLYFNIDLVNRALQRRPEQKCEELNDMARAEAGSPSRETLLRLLLCRFVLPFFALTFFEVPYNLL